MSNLLYVKRRVPRTPGVIGAGGAQTKVFTLDYTTDFANPERGWYVENSADYNFTSGENNPSPVSLVAPSPTLQMRYVRLDAYREYDYLPSGFLDTLASEMAAWRTSGRKAVLRYAYNRGSSTSNNDATNARIVNHIGQLGTLWTAYSDVIAVLQAGFIGRWGEWNSSSSGNLTSGNRSNVIDALLDAAPADLPIQLRKPVWHHDKWATALTSGGAWSGSDQSRAGIMNDSFLAGTGHGGTFYDGDGMTFASSRQYWRDIAPYVPYGGESSDLGGLVNMNTGSAAITEMSAYYLDYLNSEFWVPMISRWYDSGDLAEISRRLGYRLGLESITIPQYTSASATFNVTMDMTNMGFGKIYRKRPVNIVLVTLDGNTSYSFKILDDCRGVIPIGGQSSTLSLSGTVPAGVPNGVYSVWLELPDNSPNLNTDPRYSIRLANVGLWDGVSGKHDLGMSVVVA